MRLLQIGYGNMGRALLDRWCDGVSGDYVVIDPFAKEAHPNITLHNNSESIENWDFDYLVLGIKPQMLADVLPGYLEKLSENTAIISMMAGVSMDNIAKIAGERAIVRVMPNLPVSVGMGMSGMCANSSVKSAHRDALEAFMGQTGEFVWVDDDDSLDRFTAIAGSGPGYVFEIARNYMDAAMSLGFAPEKARKMVLNTMLGTTQMALNSDKPLDELRNNVTSKKGTTEAGLNVLRSDQDLENRFKDLVTAAYNRAIELRGG